ncbi:hypothetical protein OOT00_02575 [Desulfobotulus sp. H1]|uniref:Uncharacterized protein n=1 Tax=Desulfobotulus pelophilus TaxID=2823377 RepID=A0ABT3N5X4_9BACT|nr:hypothetical protein [Desulfobotulus pelophilus]MCW7752863.1 hypothetical protein [Desulfobotulus pelophilus]
MKDTTERSTAPSRNDGLTDDLDLSDLAITLQSESTEKIPDSDLGLAKDVAAPEMFSEDRGVPLPAESAGVPMDEDGFIDLDDILLGSPLDFEDSAIPGTDGDSGPVNGEEDLVLDPEDWVEEQDLGAGDVPDFTLEREVPAASPEPGVQFTEEILDLGDIGDLVEDLPSGASSLVEEEGDILDLEDVGSFVGEEGVPFDAEVADEDLIPLKLDPVDFFPGTEEVTDRPFPSIEKEDFDSSFLDDDSSAEDIETFLEFEEEASVSDAALLLSGEPGFVFVEEKEQDLAAESLMPDTDFVSFEDSPEADADMTPDGLEMRLGQVNFEEMLERVVRKVFSEKLDAALVAVVERAVEKEMRALKHTVYEDPEESA